MASPCDAPELFRLVVACQDLPVISNTQIVTVVLARAGSFSQYASPHISPFLQVKILVPFIVSCCLPTVSLKALLVCKFSYWITVYLLLYIMTYSSVEAEVTSTSVSLESYMELGRE